MSDTPASTTTDLKTLDYYLEHPGEMPTDPATLEALFAAREEDGDQPATGDKPTGEPKPDAAAAAAAADPDKKPDGVLAKDGKHVIPYAEMERRIAEARESGESEAAARRAAEEYSQKLERDLQDARTQLAAAAKGGDPKAVAPAVDLPAELMETLETDYPTIAQAVKAQQLLLKHTHDALNELRERMGSAETARAGDEAAEVQDLIEQVPQLATWQKNAPFLFKRAQEVEAEVLNDKDFMAAHPELKKDDVGRYNEVVKRVRAEIGLPPEDPSPQNKTDEEKADAILAAKQPQHPRSLSDMPAGKAPANSPTESLENLSSVEIGNRFMGMTPDKILEQLNRL